MAAIQAAQDRATPATLPNWLQLFDARADELGATTDQQKLELMGTDRTMRWRYEQGMIPRVPRMREIAARIEMPVHQLFAAELAA